MQRVPNSIPAIQLSAAATTIYSVPTGVITTLANVSFTNTTGSPVSITVYNVASGGVPLTANQVVAPYSIPAGKTYVPPQLIGLNMGSGATLQALAGTASAVNAQGGVFETSGS